MARYLALVRGINVGGNSLLKMGELKTALEASGLLDVSTFIQSGNVFFSSQNPDQLALAAQISKLILDHFGVATAVVVFTKQRWHDVIQHAPKWWGTDTARKHNLLILLPPYDMVEVVEAIGRLRSEVESIEPGDGVLYQSMLRELVGKVTTSRLAGSPIYKRMTVRNYNTATRLLELF